MLALSPKKTQDVDISVSLKSYIKSNYTADEYKEVEQACNELSRLRGQFYNAIGASLPMDKTKSIFTDYYSRLKGASNRFPFGPSLESKGFFGIGASKVQRNVSVDFSYTELLDSSKWVTTQNVQFEVACVLFNYAARLTREGIDIKERGGDTPIQDAANMFREASTIFDHLSKTSSYASLGTVTCDLLPQVTEFFSLLLSAYAQWMLFQKAVKANMSPNNIALVASGAAKLFDDAVKAGLSTEKSAAYLRTGGPKVNNPVNWLRIADFYKLNMLASANLWRGKVSYTAQEWGVEIAYLKCALSNVQTAARYDPDVVKASPQAVEDRKNLMNMIQGRLFDAEKDNKVYFAVVPSEVPLVDPRVLIKPAEIDDLINAIKDPFVTLVDTATRELINKTHKELEQQVNAVITGCKQLSDNARLELQRLNLPSAVEAVDNITTLPDDLWTRIEEFNKQGGLNALDQAFDNVTQLPKKLRTQLDEIRQMLHEEADDDRKMRKQFGERWTREPSETMIEPMLRTVTEVETLLGDASKADNTVKAELLSLRPSFQQFVLPRHEIEESLPKANSGGDNPALSTLRQLLSELAALFHERETLSTQVNEIFDQEMTKLRTTLSASSSPDETVTKSKTTVLDATKRLHAETQGPIQEALLAKIIEANQQFVHHKKNAPGLAQREEALQRINVALNAYTRLRGHIEEGTRFYTMVGQDTIGSLHQRASDFVFARDMEKKMWCEDLTQRLSKMSITPVQPPSGYQQQQPPQQQPPQQQQQPPQQQQQPPQQQQQQPPHGGMYTDPGYGQQQQGGGYGGYGNQQYPPSGYGQPPPQHHQQQQPPQQQQQPPGYGNYGGYPGGGYGGYGQ